MAKSKKSKEESKDYLTNPDALVEKTNEFFEDKKNQILVASIVGGISVVVLLFAGYFFYIKNQNNIAQEELYQAQYYFEADSLSLALNGDGNSYGFLEIVSEFSGTKAANLSNFYAGVCYLKLGSYEEAIRHLKDFSSSDYLVQARAYSLIGDGYMEQGIFDDAIEYYQKAVDYKSNESFTPIYLKKLAIAYEQNGNLENAIETYLTIEEKYSKSEYLGDAIKQKSRLQALAQ